MKYFWINVRKNFLTKKIIQFIKDNIPLRGLLLIIFKNLGLKTIKQNDILLNDGETKIFLKRINIIGGRILIDRIYQEYRFLEKYNLKRYNIDGFLDIGANIGQNTISSYFYFDKGIPIYAFEPSSTSFNKLKDICEGKPDIHCYNYGVGMKNNKMIFNRSLSSETSQASSFLNFSEKYMKEYAWGKASIIKEEVEIISLDSFFKKSELELGNNLLLHIDVEGYDYFVLKGASSYVLPKTKCIIIEITFNLFEGQKDFNDIYRLLSRNFEFRGCISPLSLNQEGESCYQDALFVRKL